MSGLLRCPGFDSAYHSWCHRPLIETLGSLLIQVSVRIEYRLVLGQYGADGAGGVILFNRAPHPNAAKVFVNWLLTAAAQARGKYKRVPTGQCVRGSV